MRVFTKASLFLRRIVKPAYNSLTVLFLAILPSVWFRFANAGVVKPYVLLLKDYRQNDAHTNHCIVKMLYRVAYDLKMDTLLYQLSVFHVFSHILEDPAAGAYQVGCNMVMEQVTLQMTRYLLLLLRKRRWILVRWAEKWQMEFNPENCEDSSLMGVTKLGHTRS